MTKTTKRQKEAAQLKLFFRAWFLCKPPSLLSNPFPYCFNSGALDASRTACVICCVSRHDGYLRTGHLSFPLSWAPPRFAPSLSFALGLLVICPAWVDSTEGLLSHPPHASFLYLQYKLWLNGLYPYWLKRTGFNFHSEVLWLHVWPWQWSFRSRFLAADVHQVTHDFRFALMRWSQISSFGLFGSRQWSSVKSECLAVCVCVCVCVYVFVIWGW